MRKINNKGFLLGEFTLKTIIAILCILILIYLLAGIYSAFQEKNALTKATGSLERVEDGINSVERSGKDFSYVLTEPQGWILLYFGEQQLKPKSCESQGCLCICKQTGLFSRSQSERCDSFGVCKIEMRRTSVEEGLIIEPTGIIIKNEGGEFKILKDNSAGSKGGKSE